MLDFWAGDVLAASTVSERVRRSARAGRDDERDGQRHSQPPRHALLALQRSAGNRATCAALQRFWVKEGSDYRWEADETLKKDYVQTSETRSSWFPWRRASPVYVEKPATSEEMLGGWDVESPGIKASLLADLQTVAATRQGAALLAKLATARHATVLEPSPIPLVSGPITESPRKPQYDPSDPKKGAPPKVRLQPGVAVDATQLGLEQVGGQHQQTTWNPTPSDVALYHELVHAYHQSHGTSASGRLSATQAIHDGDRDVSLSEYQCTGLDTADGVGATQFAAGEFTENKYRQEKGVAHRDTYIPRGYRVPAAVPPPF
ncbi:MAG TPA: M91 family zinc metallopeptidase [Solirubrobacter sp.]|nr:M91 family zinc metallopeptidase [Solirubrobacter sp.]